MRIPLRMTSDDGGTGKLAQPGIPERDVLATREGDFQAKARLLAAFLPLLNKLARERTADNATINRYVDAGKEGVLAAVRKYKPKGGAGEFQIFALDFIESAMDSVTKPRGFLARLFGRG